MARTKDITAAHAEAAALNTFHDTFRALHAGVLDRTTLADDFRAQLFAAEALANEAVMAAVREYGPRAVPPVVPGLRAAMQRYRVITEGTVTFSVGGEKIEAPAIESGAVRARLKSEGDSILADVDTMHRLGAERVARVAERAVDYAQRVDYWLRDRIVGPLLVSLARIEADDDSAMLPELLDVIGSRAYRYQCSHDKSAPQWPQENDRADWLPHLRARVAEMEQIAA